MRLGLALDGEWSADAESAALSVTRRAALAAFHRLGETVLLYQRVPAVSLFYLGTGRLNAIEQGLAPDNRICRLIGLRSFAVAVSGADELPLPGSRRLLLLEDSRFDAVLAAGQAGAGSALSAAEAQHGFPPAATVPLDTYLRLHDQVLRNWEYRCAITGRTFEPQGRPHPKLDLVALHPREQGGPLHVANYMPMVAAAAAAWRAGDLSADAEYGLLARLSRLDPELQDGIPPQFRLHLPRQREAWPDPALLAYHRERIFGR